MDGLELVKTLRKKQSKLPVLFLSNLGGLDDRVEGLKFRRRRLLAKPFAFSELLARVQCASATAAVPPTATTIRVGELELDLIKRQAMRAGREIDLQPREFRCWSI